MPTIKLSPSTSMYGYKKGALICEQLWLYNLIASWNKTKWKVNIARKLAYHQIFRQKVFLKPFQQMYLSCNISIGYRKQGLWCFKRYVNKLQNMIYSIWRKIDAIFYFSSYNQSIGNPEKKIWAEIPKLLSSRKVK